MRYNCIFEHIPGKALVVADALNMSESSNSIKSGIKPGFTDEFENYRKFHKDMACYKSADLRNCVGNSKCPKLYLLID